MAQYLLKPCFYKMAYASCVHYCYEVLVGITVASASMVHLDHTFDDYKFPTLTRPNAGRQPTNFMNA